MNFPQIPIWLQPQNLEDWPTKAIANNQLSYTIPIKSNWQDVPIINQNELETEHIFVGNDVGELLTVSSMNNVNPEHELSNWIQAFISLIGFPILPLHQMIEPPPQLIEWQELGNDQLLNQKLQVNETFLYQGLAQFFIDSPELIRLYILLARRKNKAWKITLSIPSACPSGTSEQLLDRNDHLRAGSIFGDLKLL